MDYILKRIYLHSDTIFLWFPVFISYGIYIFLTNNFLPIIFLSPFILNKNGHQIALALVIGMLAAFIRIHLIKNVIIKEPLEFITLEGRVKQLEHVYNGLRFVLKSDMGDLRINWKGDYDPVLVTPNSDVLVTLKIFPIKEKVSPIAFDFYRQSFFQGISANGVVLKRPIKIEDHYSIYNIFEEKRNDLNKKLFKIFSSEVAGVAAALLTGNKAGIHPKIRETFIYSGIAHILAISGLHVSLVAGFIFLLIRLVLCFIPFLVLRYNPKKIAAVFAFFGSLTYILIANGGIPATRALIMHSIVTISVLMNKSAFSMRNLSISATIILVISPEVIYSPGFYMSFFTVAALISFYQNKQNTSYNYFINILLSSIVASSAVIPFSIYFFNNLTTNSIPANLIAIPLTGTCIMPALICFTLGMTHISEFFIENGIRILLYAAKYFSSWKYSYFLLATPPVLSIQIISISMLMIFLSNKKFLGFLGILFSIVIYITAPKPLIFLNKTSDVFGINKNGNLYVSTKVKFRGVTKSWAKSVGVTEKIKLTKSGDEYIIGEISIRNLPEHILINNDIKIKKSEILRRNGCMLDQNYKIIFVD